MEQKRTILIPTGVKFDKEVLCNVIAYREIAVPTNCINPLSFEEKLQEVAKCMTFGLLYNKYASAHDSRVNYQSNAKEIDAKRLESLRDKEHEARENIELFTKSTGVDESYFNDSLFDSYLFEVGCYIAINSAPKEASVYKSSTALRQTMAYWIHWFDDTDSTKAEEHIKAKSELKDLYMDIAGHYLNTSDDDDFKNITCKRLNDTKFKTIVGNLAKKYKWTASGIKGGLTQISESKDTTKIENDLVSSILSCYLADEFKFVSKSNSDSKITFNLN